MTIPQAPALMGGLTVREYLAARAMQSLIAAHSEYGAIANSATYSDSRDATGKRRRILAREAVMCADELIDALNEFPDAKKGVSDAGVS